MSVAAVDNTEIFTTQGEIFSQLQLKWGGSEWELFCDVSAPKGFEIDKTAMSLFNANAFQGFEFGYVPQKGIDSFFADGSRVNRVFGHVELKNNENKNSVSVLSEISIFCSTENGVSEVKRSQNSMVTNPPIDFEKMPDGYFDLNTGVIRSIFWNTIPYSTTLN